VEVFRVVRVHERESDSYNRGRRDIWGVFEQFTQLFIAAVVDLKNVEGLFEFRCAEPMLRNS